MIKQNNYIDNTIEISKRINERFYIVVALSALKSI